MNIFRESIPHPKLLQLYDYWDAIRDDRVMPGRRDMDPLDIPRLLPNIALFDVEHTPLRFRIRLYGTALTSNTGSDVTGRYLDEPGVSPISLQTNLSNKKVTLTKTPHILEGLYPPGTGSNSGSHFYRLCLPLSDDGRQVSMLLVGCFREKHAIAEKQRRAAVA
ncbi:MAG: PAS domain-containing protein [Alphaproteobacteria bacterium]